MNDLIIDQEAKLGGVTVVESASPKKYLIKISNGILGKTEKYQFRNSSNAISDIKNSVDLKSLVFENGTRFFTTAPREGETRSATYLSGSRQAQKLNFNQVIKEIFENTWVVMIQMSEEDVKAARSYAQIGKLGCPWAWMCWQKFCFWRIYCQEEAEAVHCCLYDFHFGNKEMLNVPLIIISGQ